MKALGYLKAHSIDQFSITEMEIPKPIATGTNLIVQVKAVSVNPVDTKVRNSRSATDSAPVILGWDASGIVVEVGPEARGFSIGDEVYYAGDITKSGSNSEFQSIDSRITSLKPKSLSFVEAAAMPLTSITAWEALISNTSFVLDEKTKVMIIGGAGGVGSMAIQLLKAKTKAKIIATASRSDTKEWCMSLGADHVINHQNDLKIELENIGIKEVDIVFSTTHSDNYLPTINAVIRPFGHFVLIDDPKTLNVSHFKQKSIRTHWELMFTKSMFNYHPEEQGALLKEVADLVDAGAIKTTLNKTFKGMKAENFKEAHTILESAKSVGKIVIEY